MSLVQTDWTEVWLEDSSLSLLEVTLAFVLLWLTVLLELVTHLIHHNHDHNSPIDRRIVRTPLAEFSTVQKFGYNFKSNFVTARLSSTGSVRVHYLDEGPRDAHTVLLLLHGEPFWSFSWTKVIPSLRREARVIVPDLIGFGMSDKFVDWRVYSLDLHLETLTRLMDHLKIDGQDQEVVLVGHNWGWMVGAGLARLRPDLFSKLVILNTNNLPDGEMDLTRYSSQPYTINKFLVLNSFFMFFRASMNLLREHFPLGLLVHSLNRRYTSAMVEASTSPWPGPEYCGGTTAFPLMVPVTRSHPEAANMRRIREFLSTWEKPTLLLYSESSVLPWVQDGDFVVGRRLEFYQRLVPGVVRTRRVEGEVGHLVMWDDPYTVVRELHHFVRY